MMRKPAAMIVRSSLAVLRTCGGSVNDEKR